MVFPPLMPLRYSASTLAICTNIWLCKFYIESILSFNNVYTF